MMWQFKSLSEVCQIRPPKKEARALLDNDDLVSFVPMDSLRTEKKTLILDKEKYLSEVTSSYTYFAEDDVLLAKITPCFENGKLGIARGLKNKIGFGSSEFIVFRCSENIDPDYLYHFLSSDIFRQEGKGKMVGAVGHKRVSKDFIENYSIPVPPLTEQKQIVAILDDAFANIDRARQLAERNLNNARELFDSTLNKIFSQRWEEWPQASLGNSATVSSGGTPLKSNPHYWNGDIAWYSSGELNNTYTKESKERITPVGLNESNTKLFPKGSLLIGMYDTAALKMSILDRDGTFNQAIAGVMPNDKLNLEFVLHSINYQKPALLSLRRGVRQKNLNQSKIKAIQLRLPSLDEQNKVVSELYDIREKTSKLKQIYTHKLIQLEELKQSLLQKAFRGELTQKDVAA